MRRLRLGKAGRRLFAHTRRRTLSLAVQTGTAPHRHVSRLAVAAARR